MNQDPKDQSVEKKGTTGNIISETVKLGFKVGLLLSTAYAIAAIFIFIVIPIVRDIRIFSTTNLTDLKIVLQLTIFVVISTIIMAILPSSIIGMLTGAIIGEIAESRFARKNSKFVFILMSLMICFLVTLFVHILFRIKIVLSFEPLVNSYYSLGPLESYPFLFGIPTIIYIIAGGWFGWKIYSKFITS